MFEFVAFTYGLLASFILASIARNQKENRANPPIVTMLGWSLMSMSLTLSLLLASWALWHNIGTGIA